jgi:hypothetical protein
MSSWQSQCIVFANRRREYPAKPRFPFEKTHLLRPAILRAAIAQKERKLKGLVDGEPSGDSTEQRKREKKP